MGTPSLPQRACHLSPQERNRFRQLRGKRVKETVMMASLASSKLLSRAALIEHWGDLSRGSLAAAGGQGQSGLAGPCQPCQAVLSHPPLPLLPGQQQGTAMGKERGTRTASVTLSSFSLEQLLPGPCLELALQVFPMQRLSHHLLACGWWTRELRKDWQWEKLSVLLTFNQDSSWMPVVTWKKTWRRHCGNAWQMSTQDWQIRWGVMSHCCTGQDMRAGTWYEELTMKTTALHLGGGKGSPEVAEKMLKAVSQKYSICNHVLGTGKKHAALTDN